MCSLFKGVCDCMSVCTRLYECMCVCVERGVPSDALEKNDFFFAYSNGDCYCSFILHFCFVQ